jgi:hypothetical protein
LRNALETALQRPLSATLAWNHPTLAALTAHLSEDVPPNAPANASANASVLSPLPQSLVHVAAMSEQAALEALLGQPELVGE